MKREEEEKIASMEPRTHARGNKAEFDQADLVLSASMEPRTHARGNIANLLVLAVKLVASMEPRTHARGNRGLTPLPSSRSGCFNGATHSRAWKPVGDPAISDQLRRLQWSHALTRVETGSSPLHPSGHVMLQWSHALTRVETFTSSEVEHALFAASMEPRTHARGNCRLSETGRSRNRRFNGATHSRAWKPDTRILGYLWQQRFNGATHSRA